MAHNKVCTLLHHLSSFKYSKYKHRALTKQVKNASQHFFFNKTKKVNSYNGLQIKFSDCAFKTKKKKKRLKTVHYKNKNQTSLSGTSESWTDITRRNSGQLRWGCPIQLIIKNIHLLVICIYNRFLIEK